MADVQPDRAMPVHRDMLPALCLSALSPSELKVALAVLRASWGWSRATTEHRLSQTMVERLTGIRDRRQMRTAFTGLRVKGVLRLVAPHDPKANTPAVWAIVKDYDCWACLDSEVPWRQAGAFDPPGFEAPEGVEPPGRDTSEPPGVIASEPSGVVCPGHEAQEEAQVEAQGSLVGTVPVPSVDVGPDDTRTIPASTPRQEPIPPLRPGPAVKADPVLDVWAGWRDCNHTARTAPTAKQRTAIKARLTEHAVEALRAYFRWVRESPHPRATYCRENGHDGFESVMRPGHVDERMGWVKAWLAGEDQRQRAKGAAAIANYTSEAYTPDDDADPMGYGARVVIDCDRSEYPPVEACPNCGGGLPVEWSAAFGWWRREMCCEVGA